MLYASRKINLKHLTNEEKELLGKLCGLSKEIYNFSLVNIQNTYQKSKHIYYWKEVLSGIKETTSYKELGTRYSAIVKEADSNFRTYISTIANGKKYGNRWLMYDNWEKHTPPTPKKHFYPLICEDFDQREGKIIVPLSQQYRKKYKNICLELPEDLRDKKINRFIIRPLFSLSEFELILIYTSEENSHDLDFTEAVGIDLGVNNFATCATSQGKSFIMDGRYLKAIIQGSNKYLAKINRMKAKQGLKHITKKERVSRKRRDKRVNDYLNKIVHYIVKHCIENKIGNIIYGYGINFTESPNLGHKNNQIFSQMPYSRFLQKLKFQCRKHGLKIIKVNECYTSKASFLDGDELPDYISGKKYGFSGKRRYRGLYIAKNGRKINADLNGAANILSKCKSVNADKISILRRSGFAEPLRIRVLKNQTSH